MKTIQEHWEHVYSTKDSNEVSWFQEYPKTSMEFVELFDLPKSAKIIDIGGGDSRLVDALIEKGYTDITVLDISSAAIKRTQERIGAEASSHITWIVSDISEFVPGEKYDFWHDRAAFHFLTNEDAVNRYVKIASTSISNDGYLILGTFSENGPLKCSGLEIKQYSEESMSNRFVGPFKKIRCIREEHQTPFNTVQNFLFCSFKKV